MCLSFSKNDGDQRDGSSAKRTSAHPLNFSAQRRHAISCHHGISRHHGISQPCGTPVPGDLIRIFLASQGIVCMFHTYIHTVKIHACIFKKFFFFWCLVWFGFWLVYSSDFFIFCFCFLRVGFVLFVKQNLSVQLSLARNSGWD